MSPTVLPGLGSAFAVDTTGVTAVHDRSAGAVRLPAVRDVLRGAGSADSGAPGRLEAWDGLVTPAAADLAAFVAHGTADPVVPLDRGEDLASRLKSRIAEVTFQTYPVAHGLHGQELADLGPRLRGRLG